MISVDTNILVRLLVADDEAQFKLVKRVLADNDDLVLHTVLLETERALRKSYGFTGSQIAGALRAIVQMERVHAEDADVAMLAIDAFEQGMDFADAMHLAQSREADCFVTLDKGMKKRSAAIGGFIGVVTP